LSGVEAVIDKDLGAALLGVLVGADVLVVATDVPQAVLRYGTPEAEPIGKVTLSQMREYAEQGHFASGSMGPKVDAVCRFVQATHLPGVITSLERIVEAVTDVGNTGTVVVPD
jgi:carbamate kinase